MAEPLPPPTLRLRLRRAIKRVTFLCVRALVRAGGFWRAGALGRALGELQYRASGSAAARYRRDMAHALGRPSDDAQTARELREAWRINTGAVLEILSMFDRRVDPARLAENCRIEGIEHLEAASRAGRGVLLLGAHMGNGALIPVCLAASGWPVSVVYKQSRMMSAGFFQHGLAEYGIEPIMANEGMKAYARMLGALRKGRVVFIMADQGTKTSNDGIVLRFLGKDMPMPAGPAQLARHSHAPVLPFETIAAEPTWHFRIHPPMERAPGSTLEDDAAAMLRTLEAMVLRHPALWSWSHRRWRLYPTAR
ncbi:MAG: lysophospholipid acyltransferase family protein [Panacagrimonas sp.]